MAGHATSHPRPSFRRPTILVGSDATLLGRPIVGASDAASAGLYGADVDLRRAWRAPGPVEMDRFGSLRIRAVWLPSRYTGVAIDQRLDRLHAFLTRAVTAHGLRTLVVSRHGITGDSPIHGLVQDVAAQHDLRLALAVCAETLLDDPEVHLTQVAHMRRVAEEWDLDVALDLGSGELANWETEAALLRLFPRLALVRIGPLYPAGGVPTRAGGSSIPLRTVRMLADQAYSGLLSVLPVTPQPAWRSWASHPPLGAVVAAREEILAAYDRVDHYDVQHPHHSQPHG